MSPKRAFFDMMAKSSGLPIPSIRSFCQTSILQPFAIGQVAKTLQVKHHQKLFRRYERVGRATTRAARASRDQLSRMQPPDEITADVFAKDILQPVAGDGLVIGNRGQHRDVELIQAQQLVSNICRRADCRRLSSASTQCPPVEHLRHLKRPPV